MGAETIAPKLWSSAGLHDAQLHPALGHLPARPQRQGHSPTTLGRSFEFSVPMWGAGGEAGSGGTVSPLTARPG